MDVMTHDVSLHDKYTARGGRALMSGIQALVRLTLEQRRLDTERGLDTRVFVSGYQGSPLGGVNAEMERAARFLEPSGVLFRPGLNEELAATAVAGTQLLRQLDAPRHDGVTGFWYGKNPGLDRAADAIRHGNVSGTSALGGAVAWIGDDPASKSSTIPSSCELMCKSLAMPILAPGSVADILDLGLHAVALSRASGLWTGLKIVADIADASAIVDLEGLGATIPHGARADAGTPPVLVGPASLEAEHDMLTHRLALARAYARDNNLNRVVAGGPRARIGIVAAGMAHAAVQRALDDLGIDDDEVERLGLRLVRLDMPFPLDDDDLAWMVAGLETVLVVEDKTDFTEAQVKSALYRRSGAPVVIGRRDDQGRPLLSARGAIGADDVAEALSVVLGEDVLSARSRQRLADVRAIAKRRGQLPAAVPQRTPYFCSGCPHNISTRAAADTLVGVGIGCHSMVVFDEGARGRHIGPTQMGGEGAQFNGLAPFADDQHFVQNIGDGTFHHSGSLAIRAAVAAGLDITYKLLYNDAVAMTGGQQVEGRLDVPRLTRWLALEGVARVVVTTPEPDGYGRGALDPIAQVRHRDDFVEVERELAATKGVTVIVHDDRCAADERRLRKRGKLPTPVERVVINERVCEGCGDCGEKSSCLSVQPVATAFGRKTQIHQASCNSDFSCLKGDCPSFLLVEPGRRTRREPPALPVALPAPVLRVSADDVLLRMPGIGGTGVVTVSQILQMAAHLDGKHAAGLEQVGLAQKGGPVLSDLRVSTHPIAGALRASNAAADVLVGFDLLGAAADQNLDACRPGHTVAIVNTAISPTAAMITGRLPLPGSPDAALRRIAAATTASANVHVDALGLAERLFDDNMPANMVVIGAVYQHGCLPISATALEQAIRLNGAGVERNLAAFAWGRALVVDPAAVARATTPAKRPPVPADPRARILVDGAALSGELADDVALRAADLIGYQSADYAGEYVDRVRSTLTAVRARGAGDADAQAIAAAYARGLHKLMAYKDEYEVARLHLDAVEQARVSEAFGADAKVTVLLHPPLLRALGLRRKLRLRRSATIAFRVLRAARGARGHWFDPFGHAELRRLERALVGEYDALVAQAIAHLDGGRHVAAVRAVAELPELIRGYEDIKLAGVRRFRAAAAKAIEELDRPIPPTTEETPVVITTSWPPTDREQTA